MTRLGAKITVETLDDERYARIENQVMAAFRAHTADGALRRPWHQRLRRFAPVLALACAVALFYLGTRWPRPDGGMGQRTDIAHEQSARIATDGAGTTHYRFGDAELTVGPDTVLDIRREISGPAAGTVHVELSAGSIDCQVDPVPGRAPFLVHAGDVQVTVVGTAFRVERDQSVRVSVTRGKVRVDTAGGSQLLGAGESWSGPATLLAAADDAGAGTGAGVAPDMPAGDREHGREHEARAPDAPEHEGSRPRGTRARSENARNTSTRPKPGKRTAEQRELVNDKPERGRPPAGNEDLAALMAVEKDDAKAALERYREYALGRGDEAEFALYSQAYLQHLILGQSRAALATLNHYQRRFARGAHRESALWLRIHILCDRSDDLEKCRAAAHTYLSRFPNGRHRKLAGRIIHWDM